jgi:halogenation protein CepH
VFSTGVHLATMAGYLGARAVEGMLRSAVPAGDALADYDRRYRTAFERYRSFLYFFYDHHTDPESYFWTARKLLNPEGPLEARTAFVRLMSGTADLIGNDAQLATELAERHARFGDATARGKFGATVDGGLFRVRGTLKEM